MPRRPAYNEPLPDCEGPKLYPFRNQGVPIEFIRMISDNTPASSIGGGPHAHIFEVSILSRTYALKIVRNDIRSNST